MREFNKLLKIFLVLALIIVQVPLIKNTVVVIAHPLV